MLDIIIHIGLNRMEGYSLQCWKPTDKLVKRLHKGEWQEGTDGGEEHFKKQN